MSSRISTLAKAVKEHPEDSFYKFTLALEMLKIEQPVKARILFEAIRNDDPEYVGVYYHLAKLYSELNENKKALETYKEGIKVAEDQNDQHTKSELSAALLNLEIEMEEGS
ncbi:tetratricopeptide repeat protein [Gracilimonas halophila]|jgi:Tfp pilus assembly protein PilF|uniref:Tetratricopeptide repeat protein n=1 Tax=Gracilimonas halophila TaxID=1834464 RepID=A0ABW5JIQ1_9BACT